MKTEWSDGCRDSRLRRAARRPEGHAVGPRVSCYAAERMDEVYVELLAEAGGPRLRASIRALDAGGVESFEADWQPLLRRFGARDAEWPWRSELEELRAAGGHVPGNEQLWEMAQLVGEDDALHALVSLSYPVEARLPPAGGLVYVERLAVAPWNRAEVKPDRRVLGCGMVLLRHVVTRSLALDLAGRVGLHSLDDPNTHAFYERVGMVGVAEDLLEEGKLRYYELDERRAEAFLSRTGS